MSAEIDGTDILTNARLCLTSSVSLPLAPVTCGSTLLAVSLKSSCSMESTSVGVICEWGLCCSLVNELICVSESESCGEMKRAVGRGPVVELPPVFLRID